MSKIDPRYLYLAECAKCVRAVSGAACLSVWKSGFHEAWKVLLTASLA